MGLGPRVKDLVGVGHPLPFPVGTGGVKVPVRVGRVTGGRGVRVPVGVGKLKVPVKVLVKVLVRVRVRVGRPLPLPFPLPVGIPVGIDTGGSGAVGVTAVTWGTRASRFAWWGVGVSYWYDTRGQSCE